eukprot:scaffold162853_cov14-Tisochrysis_lutea.AAC.1
MGGTGDAGMLEGAQTDDLGLLGAVQDKQEGGAGGMLERDDVGMPEGADTDDVDMLEEARDEQEGGAGDMMGSDSDEGQGGS